MTAVSSSSVCTVSKVGGWPAIARPIVSVPSIGESAAGSAVIMKKCSQPSACPNPACPSWPIGSSGGALEAEVGLRVGVAEVVGDLAALEQHVERHDRGARLEDPPVDDREVRQVRAAQRHLVAGLDPTGDEQVGDLVGGAVDLRVGQPGAGGGEHDGVALGVRRRARLEQGGEVVGHGNLPSGGAAPDRRVTARGAAGGYGAERARDRRRAEPDSGRDVACRHRTGSNARRARRRSRARSALGPAAPASSSVVSIRGLARAGDVGPGWPTPRLAVDVLDRRRRLPLRRWRGSAR